MSEILFSGATIKLITEGLELDELLSHDNFHQIINTPTHIFPNS